MSEATRYLSQIVDSVRLEVGGELVEACVARVLGVEEASHVLDKEVLERVAGARHGRVGAEEAPDQTGHQVLGDRVEARDEAVRILEQLAFGLEHRPDGGGERRLLERLRQPRVLHDGRDGGRRRLEVVEAVHEQEVERHVVEVDVRDVTSGQLVADARPVGLDAHEAHELVVGLVEADVVLVALAQEAAEQLAALTDQPLTLARVLEQAVEAQPDHVHLGREVLLRLALEQLAARHPIAHAAQLDATHC